MKAPQPTKLQLNAELETLRQRVAKLEVVEGRYKQTQSDLRDLKRVAQSTLDAVPEHICVLDEKGSIITVNQAWRRFTIANPPISHNVSEGANYLSVCEAVTGPDAKDAQAFAAGIRAVLAGEREEFELEYPCHSATEQRWFVGKVTPLRSSGPTRVVITHADITRHKLAEQQGLYLAKLIDRVPEAVITTDLDFSIIGWNPAAEQIYHWAAFEVQGKRVTDILRTEFLPGEREKAQQELLERGAWTGEIIQHRRDGTPVCVIASTTLLRDDAGNPVRIFSINHDISDRKHMEDALRASDERLALALASSNQGIWDWNIVRDEAHLSPKYYELTGYAGDEVHADSKFFFSLIHPDDLPTVVKTIEEHFQGKSEYSKIEYRLRRKSGEYRWTYGMGRVIERNEQGAPVRMIGVITDSTERKQTEEALLRFTKELEARNEELDAFAHTVAHDLKNPVAMLIGFAELLMQEYDKLAEIDRQRSLQTMMKIGYKMDRIIDELLLLASARQETVEVEQLDMFRIVAESISRVKDMIDASHANIEVLNSSQWPAAVGYDPWVEEVWINYLINALKYAGDSPRIKLGAELQADGMVCFWVHDDGPGISPEAQASLFRPFTRIDQIRARGHGLGLSIVRRIVEKLGGQAGVDSILGQGAKFYFTLPAKKG